MQELIEMQHEVQHMRWLPVVATVGRAVRFFDVTAMAPGRKRSLLLGQDVPPVDDILSLAESAAGPRRQPR